MSKHNFTINPDDKFYPEVNEWMWSYCIFLGKFTDSKGNNHDLGIHINKEFPEDSRMRVSDATVYGNEPGAYTSGPILLWKDMEGAPERVKEVYRRVKILNLI